MEVREIEKNSRRAFFGQILESAGPKLNSSKQVDYNLVFLSGRIGNQYKFSLSAQKTRLKNCLNV